MFLLMGISYLIPGSGLPCIPLSCDGVPLARAYSTSIFTQNKMNPFGFFLDLGREWHFKKCKADQKTLNSFFFPIFFLFFFFLIWPKINLYQGLRKAKCRLESESNKPVRQARVFLCCFSGLAWVVIIIPFRLPAPRKNRHLRVH